MRGKMSERKEKPQRVRTRRSLSEIVVNPKYRRTEKERSFSKADTSSNPETARMQKKIIAHNKSIIAGSNPDETGFDISSATHDLFCHIPPRKTRP